MITARRVRQLLSLDRATGIFRWKVDRRGGVKAGDVAGWRSGNGYWMIGIDGHTYYAHRLAWLYVHGRWPKDKIDHHNTDKLTNRFSNLREASNSQNQMNQRLSAANTSGYKGVYRKGDKYIAQLKKDGKHHYLGIHETPEAASAAYALAAKELFGEFARLA